MKPIRQTLLAARPGAASEVDSPLGRALEALLRLDPPVEGMSPLPEHFERVQSLLPETSDPRLAGALDAAQRRQAELRRLTAEHEAAVASLRREAARSLREGQREIESALDPVAQRARSRVSVSGTAAA